MIKFFLADLTKSLLRKLDETTRKQKRDSCDSVFQGSRTVDNLRKMLRQLTNQIKGFAEFIAEFSI